MSLPTIEGGWRCVLLDAPWDFQGYNDDSHVPTQADDPYETMGLEALKALPVPEVLAEDAAVFMWAIDSHFEQAFELGRAWGLTYRSLFVWVKSKPGGWPHFGMGKWNRKQAELLLIFAKGSPPILAHDVPQLIHCPRGAHSAKPELQYDYIERLVVGPRLEMFARMTRPGWAAWGLEVGARDPVLF